MNLQAAAYVYIFLFSLGLSALLTPLAIRLSRRLGMMDEPGERKIHQTAIPLLGGAAVFVAFAAAILLNALIVHILAARGEWLFSIAHGFAARKWMLSGVLLGGLLMLGLGMVDDKQDLSPLAKLVGQILIASLAVALGLRVKLFLPNEWLAAAVTILWIVTVTNAMNFLDNMDGLCAGVGAVGALCFAVVAGVREQFLVCGLSLAFAGTMIGFLFYNFHPARIFLGDSGSHWAGFTLAVLAILPTFYSADGSSLLAVLIPLFVLALPLFDLCAVIWIRLRAGRPIYRGDTSHFSHRIAALGIGQRVTVLILYLIALALGLGGVLLLWLPPLAGVLVVGQGVLMLLVVSLLQHYSRNKTYK